MPRISEERRAARREQIIRAALRCAIRSGLDGMTMAQVITESGLSAGAVYGYFDSKADLIAAVVDSRLTDVLQSLSVAVDAHVVPPMSEIFESIARSLDEAARSEDGDLTVMITLAWAELAKGRATRDVVKTRLMAVLDAWTAIVRRHQEAGTLDPSADAADLARVLQGSLPGYIVMRLTGSAPSPQAFGAAWQSLLGWRPGLKGHVER